MRRTQPIFVRLLLPLMRATRLIPILLWGLVATFAGTGCSTEVAGPPGVDEPFSVYGILNPHLDTQTVLVSTTEAELKPIGATIDALVTSTNLQTGVTHEWRDSVVTGPTGQIDHIFWADFRPDYGSRHRLEVRRSDGATTSVETDIPELITLEQEDTRSRHFIVTLYGEAFRPLHINAHYGVRAFYVARPQSINARMPYSEFAVSVKGNEEKIDGGWRIPIDLNIKYESLRSRYFDENMASSEWFTGFWNPICDGLALEDMRISVTVGSDEWDPPGGNFDPFVQSFPRAFSNVQNGFGFVTGGYDFEAPVFPSTMSLDDTWFFDSIGSRTPRRVGCGLYVGA